jgi:hypothetical protein
LYQSGFQFNREWTNPGVELLRVQFPLKMGEAVAPEIVHVLRRKSAKIKSDGGKNIGQIQAKQHDSRKELQATISCDR